MRFTSKAAAFAVIGWASSGRAAEPVRLPDLIAEALRNNPEVLAAQKNYEAARQRPPRESSLPDPTLSVGYASNGGPLPGQQLGSNPTSNIGFMVSQEIPYPGKRKLRGDIAAKEAEAEFWQYQAVELNVRSRSDAGVSPTAPHLRGARDSDTREGSALGDASRFGSTLHRGQDGSSRTSSKRRRSFR